MVCNHCGNRRATEHDRDARRRRAPFVIMALALGDANSLVALGGMMPKLCWQGSDEECEVWEKMQAEEKAELERMRPEG